MSVVFNEPIDDTTIEPATLLAEIASGNKKYEQYLVSNYWKGLYFVLNRRAQNPDLAADLAQETMLIVITKARNGEIENPAALPAYIRQTGVNLLIAHYRKETRRKTEDTDDIDVQFANTSVDASEKINIEQLVCVVKQVINELPTERDRQIILRHFQYGQNKAVVCQELELSTEHFDRVLFRARQRLKQILQAKLNVDLSKTSLSQLFSVALVCFVYANIATSELNLIKVREGHSPLHIENSKEVKPSTESVFSATSLQNRRSNEAT